MEFDATQALDFLNSDDEQPRASQDKVPVAHLKVLAQENAKENVHPVFEGENIIGRRSENNITIQARTISKKHAVIEVNGDLHLIKDLNSINKTKKGKLTLKPDLPYMLADGDTLLLGDVACIYTKVEQPQVEAPDSDAGTEVLNTTSPLTMSIHDENGTVPMTDARKSTNLAICLKRENGTLLTDSDSSDEEISPIVIPTPTREVPETPAEQLKPVRLDLSEDHQQPVNSSDSDTDIDNDSPVKNLTKISEIVTPTSNAHASSEHGHDEEIDEIHEACTQIYSTNFVKGNTASTSSGLQSANTDEIPKAGPFKRPTTVDTTSDTMDLLDLPTQRYSYDNYCDSKSATVESPKADENEMKGRRDKDDDDIRGTKAAPLSRWTDMLIESDDDEDGENADIFNAATQMYPSTSSKAGVPKSDEDSEDEFNNLLLAETMRFEEPKRSRNPVGASIEALALAMADTMPVDNIICEDTTAKNEETEIVTRSEEVCFTSPCTDEESKKLKEKIEDVLHSPALALTQENCVPDHECQGTGPIQTAIESSEVAEKDKEAGPVNSKLVTNNETQVDVPKQTTTDASVVAENSGEEKTVEPNHSKARSTRAKNGPSTKSKTKKMPVKRRSGTKTSKEKTNSLEMVLVDEKDVLPQSNISLKGPCVENSTEDAPVDTDLPKSEAKVAVVNTSVFTDKDTNDVDVQSPTVVEPTPPRSTRPKRNTIGKYRRMLKASGSDSESSSEVTNAVKKKSAASSRKSVNRKGSLSKLPDALSGDSNAPLDDVQTVSKVDICKLKLRKIDSSGRTATCTDQTLHEKVNVQGTGVPKLIKENANAPVTSLAQIIAESDGDSMDFIDETLNSDKNCHKGKCSPNHQLYTKARKKGKNETVTVDKTPGDSSGVSSIDAKDNVVQPAKGKVKVGEPSREDSEKPGKAVPAKKYARKVKNLESEDTLAKLSKNKDAPKIKNATENARDRFTKNDQPVLELKDVGKESEQLSSLSLNSKADTSTQPNPPEQENCIVQKVRKAWKQLVDGDIPGDKSSKCETVFESSACEATDKLENSQGSKHQLDLDTVETGAPTNANKATNAKSRKSSKQKNLDNKDNCVTPTVEPSKEDAVSVGRSQRKTASKYRRVTDKPEATTVANVNEVREPSTPIQAASSKRISGAQLKKANIDVMVEKDTPSDVNSSKKSKKDSAAKPSKARVSKTARHVAAAEEADEEKAESPTKRCKVATAEDASAAEEDNDSVNVKSKTRGKKSVKSGSRTVPATEDAFEDKHESPTKRCKVATAEDADAAEEDNDSVNVISTTRGKKSAKAVGRRKLSQAKAVDKPTPEAGAGAHRSPDKRRKSVPPQTSKKPRKSKKDKLAEDSDSESLNDFEEPSTSPTRKPRGAKKAPAEDIGATPASTPKSSLRRSKGSPRVGQKKEAAAEVANKVLPKIMFTGLSDQNLEKIVKDLKGTLVDSVFECTHLVTDRVRRTWKFLCLLSRGCHIVTPDWLQKCKAEKSFIEFFMFFFVRDAADELRTIRMTTFKCNHFDESAFIIKDEAAEKLYKFKLEDTLLKARTGTFLNGFRLHVTKNVKPPPVEMQTIIQCAGGTYLARMPTSGAKTIVITCPEDLHLCTKARKAGLSVVRVEFILTGVLRHEVDIVSYRC